MCLYIDICVQKLCTAHLCAGAGIKQALGAFAEIYPQVLNAVLIPAAIRDLSGVYGHGLLQILRIAAQGVLAVFRHSLIPPDIMEN